VQTNLVGTYHCVRAAQRHFAADGWRDVVVKSSILARIPVPGYTGYSASKAGLLGLVRSFAAELAPDDVQVHAICRGLGCDSTSPMTTRSNRRCARCRCTG
jgi:3-oxoacyl-[acyl-carrier protein] reductase